MKSFKFTPSWCKSDVLDQDPHADHTVEFIREEDGSVLVEFHDHENIEKDALIATMAGKNTQYMGCVDIYLEITGAPNKQTLSYALYRAVRWARDIAHPYEKASLLLDAGADPNHTPPGLRWNDESPLHWAAEHDMAPLVKLLLDHGANKYAVAKGDRLPCIYAKSFEVRELLTPDLPPDFEELSRQLEKDKKGK